MNEELQKTASELLKTLSEQLGTTVDQLWVILVKQAFVSAVVNGWGIFCFVTLLFIIYFFNWKYYTKIKKWAEKGPEYSDREDVPSIIVVGCTIVSIISIILIGVEIGSMIPKLLNPEYWALNKILSLL